VSWFRRTTTPPARMDAHEARIACAWGFTTEEEWQSLADWERASYRANYTKAPRFIS